MPTMRKSAGLLLGFIFVSGLSGCLGPIPSLPAVIPVPPWVSDRMEEKYTRRFKERTPIMPPILPGQPLPTCEDPPSEEEIIRALPKVTRGIPFVYEEFRDSYEIVVEKIVDRIDPPCHIPLIGPAQVHHCRYKCTVFWREQQYSDYPFPFGVKNDRAEVIYIDKDHAHLYAGNDPRYQKALAKELFGY